MKANERMERDKSSAENVGVRRAKSITCCCVSCPASASTRSLNSASIADCWWSNWKDSAARADPRGHRPRMSYPATTDSSLPRYGGCDEDNAAAVAHDPDATSWRDVIAAASSPGCCRWHRTATAMPLTHFTKINFSFHEVILWYCNEARVDSREILIRMRLVILYEKDPKRFHVRT